MTNGSSLCFINYFVFEDKCQTLQRFSPFWHKIMGLIVVIDSLQVVAFVVQNVGKSENQTQILRIVINCNLIPLYAPLHLLFVIFQSQVAQRKGIVGSP